MSVAHKSAAVVSTAIVVLPHEAARRAELRRRFFALGERRA